MIERIFGAILEFYSSGVKAGAFQKRSSRHFLQSVLGVTLFHYSSQEFGARLFEADDVFAPELVAWRGRETRSLLLDAVLVEPVEPLVDPTEMPRPNL